MATINLQFRSQGANVAAAQLQGLQRNLQSTSQATAQLARNLGTTFTRAQQFANGLGTTAQQANTAVERLRQLQRSNATIGQQFAALNRELGITRDQFSRLFNTLEDVDRQLNSLQLGAVALGFSQLTRILVDLGEVSTETFVRLERNLNTFAAVSGATQEELNSVAEQVRLLGSTSANTALQISESAIALTRLGFSAEQVVNILPAINAASIATGESTETLAGILGNVVSQFNLAGEGQARFLEITDQLVATANSSATNVQQLGQSLSFVGATANNANQSVETTLALLGLFANAGVRGTRSGVALANILNRLRNAAAEAGEGANEAAQAFSELGVQVTDQSGQLLPFDRVLIDIINRLREIEDVGERGVILTDLFGLEQGRDFNALLNLSNEQIETFIQNLENSTGAADQASQRILQGLSGSLQEFNSALEEAQTVAGENLAVFAEPLVDSARLLISTFNALPAPVQASLVTVASFTTALAAATAAVSALTLAERTLGITQTARNVATAAGTAATNAGSTAIAINTALNTRLTLALVAQTAAAQASRAATLARAIATNTATAATSASVIALGTLAGLLAGLTASIGLVVNEFNSLTSAARETNNRTDELRTQLSGLQEDLSRLRESTDESEEGLRTFAETNFDNLQEELNVVTRSLDTVREAGNRALEAIGLPPALLSAGEAAANRQTVAFSEQIETIDDLIGEYFELQRITTQTGQVNQESTQRTLTALNAARTALQQERPVTEAAAATRRNYLDLLDNSISTLEELSSVNDESTESLRRNTEATEDQISTLQEYNELLREAEQNARRAATEIAIAETERLIDIERLLEQDVINNQEAEELKREATISRIREELEAEQAKIDELSQISIEEGQLVRRNQDEINRARRRTLDLTLQLLREEREADEETVEAIARNRENLFERISGGLARISRLNEQSAQLGSDIGTSAERLVDLQLQDLQRALQIRVELDTDDISVQERRDLERELRELSIEGRTTERALLDRILDGEETLARIRQDNLDERQRREQEILAIEERRLEIELRRAEIEARRNILAAQEEIQATEALQDTARTDEEAAQADELNRLAVDSLSIAEEELSLIQDQISGLDTVIARKRISLGISKEIADEELRQETGQRLADFDRTFREVAGPPTTVTRFRTVEPSFSIPTISPTVNVPAANNQISVTPEGGDNAEIIQELRTLNRNLNTQRPNVTINNEFQNQVRRPSDRQLLNQVRNELTSVFNDIEV